MDREGRIVVQHPKASNVLLTLDDVRAWKRERDTAAARILELDKKLSAVAGFMPEEARLEIFGTAQIPGEPRLRDDKSALSKFVGELLENGKKLFSVAEVESVAKNTEHAEFVSQNPGVVEDVLLNSARKGRLRKRGDLFYHTSLDDESSKAQAAVPDYGAAEYFREIISTAAAKRQDGMATRDVISLVKADARGQQKIAGNPQYAYSLIGRMIAKGFLTKVDGRLYHPSRSPAPSDASPSSQSEKAADPKGDQAAFASESPAGATLLPFAAQAAE